METPPTPPLQTQIDVLVEASLANSKAITDLSAAIQALCVTRDEMRTEIAPLKEWLSALELAHLPIGKR